MATREAVAPFIYKGDLTRLDQSGRVLDDPGRSFFTKERFMRMSRALFLSMVVAWGLRMRNLAAAPAIAPRLAPIVAPFTPSADLQLSDLVFKPEAFEPTNLKMNIPVNADIRWFWRADGDGERVSFIATVEDFLIQTTGTGLPVTVYGYALIGAGGVDLWGTHLFDSPLFFDRLSCGHWLQAPSFVLPLAVVQ